MLLNLQRVVIALVNNMAIAENIAYQTINRKRRLSTVWQILIFLRG